MKKQTQNRKPLKFEVIFWGAILLAALSLTMSSLSLLMLLGILEATTNQVDKAMAVAAIQASLAGILSVLGWFAQKNINE